ncbi:hypothetical protein [Ktedonobacter racemifer]|uniref:Uncharacterized protein n=1 Tax=Ktedonobacter racemifer DSM 44963 TaxID=485913 RepID=D6U4P8_KTERA|nr:hypothetical protein [Ktedonobacter racemifer]EFH81478.1 hypothetical protein Krac_2204 [Ktedonobacter racemifer DSM 44963]
MQDKHHVFDPSQSMGERKQPISLVAQLLQATVTMHHVDEVLLWLSDKIGQYLGIPVVQFWTMQLDRSGELHAEVRASASQLPSLPQQATINQYMVSVVDRLLLEQHGIASLPVADVFSPVLASFLTRYGLQYWAGYFLQHEMLLPPARSDSEVKQSPTPLTVIVSFFSQSSLSKEQERAIAFILEQALRILINRRFLAAPDALLSPTPDKQSRKSFSGLTLADIVPRRAQDLEAFQADNPFANAAILADKNARRLYAAIDGRKTMADLMKGLAFGPQEGAEAFRYLLNQQKIQLSTLDEKPLESFSIIDSLF